MYLFTSPYGRFDPQFWSGKWLREKSSSNDRYSYPWSVHKVEFFWNRATDFRLVDGLQALVKVDVLPKPPQRPKD